MSWSKQYLECPHLCKSALALIALVKHSLIMRHLHIKCGQVKSLNSLRVLVLGASSDFRLYLREYIYIYVCIRACVVLNFRIWSLICSIFTRFLVQVPSNFFSMRWRQTVEAFRNAQLRKTRDLEKLQLILSRMMLRVYAWSCTVQGVIGRASSVRGATCCFDWKGMLKYGWKKHTLGAKVSHKNLLRLLDEDMKMRGHSSNSTLYYAPWLYMLLAPVRKMTCIYYKVLIGIFDISTRRSSNHMCWGLWHTLSWPWVFTTVNASRVIYTCELNVSFIRGDLKKLYSAPNLFLLLFTPWIIIVYSTTEVSQTFSGSIHSCS